ncbi:exportin-6-A [Contarinia nasturtii]|uniref:exportin-6-A n=1 Tax=Contarinia nasturtii TaxID=265458 RepID=UPI0012D39FCE|nr:exportin-6-A [Contarinia nasturtii]
MVTSIPLSAIEGLLNEFNYPSTSNARKHEIEKQLIEFQNDIRSWPQCLYQLNNATANGHQFFWFFNASTIEAAIVRKWKYLDESDRMRLRDTLWNCYANLNVATVSRVQREKIAQLIALMGKREFPDEHSSYMCHLMELLKTNFILGITLLRTTSEELVSTRDDITSDRKKYFHSNLSLCMPEVFQLLTKFLVIHAYGLNGIDFATVPSNFLDRELIQSLPKDNRLCLSAIELLSCVQHLLSWTSTEELLHEQLLINLFDLANWKEHDSDVSVAALGAITELFYRQQTLPLPHVIANGIKNILKQPRLIVTNEMYQDKLTELLRLFIAQQWSRWIDDEIVFPEFITALYSFTFESYAPLPFTEKLTIWHPIITGLASSGFGRYTQTMHLLVAGILQKIQFRVDLEELKTLDNENLDDDMLTDWQHYLTQCIETIALVAEVKPLQVFEQVYSEWSKPFEIFESLEKSIDSNGTLIINDNQRSQLVYCILRDLSSLCQTLTRLTPILQGCLQEIPKNLSQITYCLIYAIKFIAVNKLHSISFGDSSLSTNFVEIFAQLLNSIRNLLPWSPILRSEHELKSLIENVAQILMPPSNLLQEPKMITLAAAQFLLTVSSVNRPQYMLDCLSFKQLIQMGNNLTYLDQQAATIIRNAIVNCLVLSWPNVSNAEQAFDRRLTLLQEYVHNLSENMLNLDHSVMHNQHDKVIKVITVILPILNEIIDHHRESSSSVKQMLVSAYRPPITKSILIYKEFGAVSEEIASCVLKFALSVIRTLQIQLGSQYIFEMLDIFIKTTTREQLTTNRYKAVEKLLQMLLLVVQQPGSLGANLLPSILDFTLNFVSPLLMQGRNPSEFCDVAHALYCLFDGILTSRWQYFYKSQVLRGFSPGASDQPIPIEDQPEHAHELLAIMNSYGQALVQIIDPHITQTVLTSLQCLHGRWKLFNRQFFKTNLLGSFLETLLGLLISPNGILHQDQLISVLFNMSHANETALQTAFVTLGYAHDSKFIHDICSAKDFPTFSAKTAQWVADAKCIQSQ